MSHTNPDPPSFDLFLTPDTNPINFDDLFDISKNGLLVQVSSNTLEIVHGVTGLDKTPLDLRLQIGTVCYKVPLSTAVRIRTKNGGRVKWRTTRYLIEPNNEGSFRLWWRSPAVF